MKCMACTWCKPYTSYLSDVCALLGYLFLFWDAIYGDHMTVLCTSRWLSAAAATQLTYLSPIFERSRLERALYWRGAEPVSATVFAVTAHVTLFEQWMPC